MIELKIECIPLAFKIYSILRGMVENQFKAEMWRSGMTGSWALEEFHISGADEMTQQAEELATEVWQSELNPKDTRWN